MPKRVVIDTNVFVYGFEFPYSNSAKIMKLINEGEIEAVITQTVLDETVRYFKNFHGKELAAEFRHYLLEVCVIITEPELKAEMAANRGKINDEHAQKIAAAQHLQLKLVSYDRDFEGFEEYIIPREFIKKSGRQPAGTKY